MDRVCPVIPAWCPDVLVVPDSGSWTSECGTCWPRVPARRCPGTRRSRGRERPSAACVSASRCEAVVRCHRVEVECSLVDTAPWDSCTPCTRELSAPTCTIINIFSSSSSSSAAAAAAFITYWPATLAKWRVSEYLSVRVSVVPNKKKPKILIKNKYKAVVTWAIKSLSAKVLQKK